jgi:hypothetical protein
MVKSNVDYVLQHVNFKHSCNVMLIDATKNSVEIDETVDKLIIDLSTVYSRAVSEKEIQEKFSKLNINIPWTIITSNSDYYKKDESNIIYYPFYLLDGIASGSKKDVNIVSLRSNIAGYLTYHLHWHRLLILIQLVKQHWFSKCLVNLEKIEDFTESQLNSYIGSLPRLTQDEQIQVKELFKLAPLIADTTDLQEEIVNIKNVAFTDAYINILTESDYPNNFITEKSIKPFLAGQFSAVIAHPKVYKHLEELGFDLLSDYINLNTGTLDIRQNIKNIIKQITTIEDNIEELWNLSYVRRLHNYNLIRDPKTFNTLTNDLQNWLNK